MLQDTRTRAIQPGTIPPDGLEYGLTVSLKAPACATGYLQLTLLYSVHAPLSMTAATISVERPLRGLQPPGDIMPYASQISQWFLLTVEGSDHRVQVSMLTPPRFVLFSLENSTKCCVPPHSRAMGCVSRVLTRTHCSSGCRETTSLCSRRATGPTGSATYAREPSRNVRPAPARKMTSSHC